MAKPSKYNFSGYLTKYGTKCDDGRTIQPGAFKEMDGKTVPLVYQHGHDDPKNILGHAILEHREDGVYMYGVFNDTENAQHMDKVVKHGDVVALSVYANQLIEKAKQVIHGVIREASLCLAGQNPGAMIDNLVMSHADGSETPIEDEAIIYGGIPLDKEEPAGDKKFDVKKIIKHAVQKGGKTLAEVLATYNEEQTEALIGILGQVLEEGVPTGDGTAAHSNNGKGDEGNMKSNVFDGSALKKKDGTAMTHADLMKLHADAIADVAKYNGSFAQAFIAHATTYGFENIEVLFPDAKTIDPEPAVIGKDMSWVAGVINKCFKSPFSRVKTLAVDITEATARARGYIKAGLKLEQFYKLLYRITTPTNVITKQKLDRQDIVDIGNNLNIVPWMKKLMRMLLDWELARAIFVGDGRDATLPGGAPNPDKIDEDCLRPIWTDDDLYSVKVAFEANVTPLQMIDKIVEAQKDYTGSGNPVLYIAKDIFTAMMLLRDQFDHRLYRTKADLAMELLASDIIPIPIFDETSRVDGPNTLDLVAILVNLGDYSLGTDKGGEVNYFEGFDIDYNQLKSLMETRLSGALTLPHSAIVFEQKRAQ